MAPGDCCFQGREVDAVNAKIAGGEALVGAGEARVNGKQHGRGHEVVVQTLRQLIDALLSEPLGRFGVVVVFGDVMDGCFTSLPLAAERGSDLFHALKIAKTVAEKDDVLKTVRLVAVGDFSQ